METALSVICISFCFVALCPSPIFTIPEERFYPFGSAAGDESLPRVLDNSSPTVPLTITPFPYFGQFHSQLFVNSNGHITFFEADGTFIPEPFPIAGDRQVIAPFWADSDTTHPDSGLVWYRITTDLSSINRAVGEIQKAFVNQRTFTPAWLLIATWDHVGVFPSLADTRNTFQCVLATDGDISFVIFLYADDGIEWLWSSYHLERPAQVGFNAGDGIRYFSHPDSFTTRLFNIPTTTNIEEPGVWVFKVDGEEVVPAGCSDEENVPLFLSPRYGHMFGGTPVVVSGPCFSPTDELICQYDSVIVTGVFVNMEQILCVSPTLDKIGEVKFTLQVLSIVRQRITSFESTFISVSPERSHVVDIESPTLMLHGDDMITVKWSPEDILPSFLSQNVSSLFVDISLYRQQYTQDGPDWKVSWKDVAVLEDIIMGTDGAARVEIPQQDFICRLPLHVSTRSVAIGLCPVALKVSVSKELRRFSNFVLPSSVGVWSGVAFLESSDPDLNFRQVCDDWGDYEMMSDVTGESLLQDVMSCPPNEFLARFDPFYEEEVFTSLFRTTNFPTQMMDFLHPGVAVCYQQATPNSANAGQQCCYTSDGSLLKGEPAGGSVDSMSAKIDYNRHLSDDVVPYIYCCKGQPGLTNCQQYYELRPSGDEEGYVLPIPACVYGDPHIVTVDGLKYTFNGKGEFTMIETADNSFTLQGRMEPTVDPDGNPTPGTVFTALVARQHETDTTVQFELRSGGLRVRLNGKVVNFDDISEVVTDSVTVADMGNQTVAAIFKIGAKMEIKVENGIISVMLITLPDSFKEKTRGLMGTFNGDTSDDLLPKTESKAISVNSSLEVIHNQFGITWILKSASESFFTYNPGESFSTFHDETYTPAFKPSFTNSTLEKIAKEVCGDDEYCLFDIAATKKVEIGMATMEGGESFDMIVNMSVPIVCDPPCVNGACIENDTCSCNVGFEGDKCNKPVVSDCEVNMCQNNGTCMKHVLTYTCDCPPGYIGAFCQEKEPPFHIRLVNSSPRVGGGVLLIDFETSMSAVSAKCFLTGQKPTNCDSGHARYTDLPTGSYVFRVLARTVNEEKAVVRRIVHIGDSGDDDFCAVHLINQGVIVKGKSVTLFFAGTKAVDTYRCRLRGNNTDTSFKFCRSPIRYEGLEVGTYRFQVLPIGCDKGKRLSIKFDIF